MKRRKSYSFVHSIFFSSRYMESAYSASLSLFTWLCLLLQHIYLQRVEQMLHTLVVVVKSGSVYYNMSNVVSNISLFHTESLQRIVTTQIFHFLLSLLFSLISSLLLQSFFLTSALKLKMCVCLKPRKPSFPF